MVKGFDKTQSDPSKLVLDYLFSFTESNISRVTPEDASIFIKSWIRNSTLTSWAYKQFEYIKLKPKIILHKKCPTSLFSWAPQQGDKHFPAFIKQDQINICLDNVRNKIELKQNVDRELYTAYHLNNTKQKRGSLNQQQQDKILMESLYEGCQQGYRNYGWQQQVRKRVAKKCAVYLFRRRSTSNLPPDSLFRYSSKMAEQYCI